MPCFRIACWSLLFTLLLTVRVGFSQTVTIAAAGDIACSSFDEVSADRCQMAATAGLVAGQHVDAVLALGDLQYPQGGSDDFATSYDKSWGRFKRITYPVPGNHEYYLYEAQGYYRYFGGQARPKHHGYYSFDLGAWHIIALNSNCFWVGGCSEDSEQIAWLRRDLKAHPSSCTLAFWHHPRFSSGAHGSDGAYQPFWSTLNKAGADLVLSAHDHLYERFAPQLGDGTLADEGMPQFVVGTGGKSFYERGERRPHSVALVQKRFGVLFLTLEPTAYRWLFRATNGEISDSGVGKCR